MLGALDRGRPVTYTDAMALIIPVGYAQAVYEMALDADPEPVVTTLGHDLTAVSGGDYADVADDLKGIFNSSWGSGLSNSYVLTGVSLYVGQDGGPPAIYESTTAGTRFGASAAPLPQNCALLVRKRTSAAGRRGRGRCYLPGVGETTVDHTGAITSTQLSGYQGMADTWYDALTAPGAGLTAYPPVVLHRSEGFGVEPPPTPITAFQVDGRIATQRRRMRK